MIKEKTSMRGTMHKKYGVPNQDAAGIFELDGALGAVLCDGVSLNSAMEFSRSEIAADFCVEEAGKYLMEHVRRDQNEDQLFDLMTRLFDHVERALDRYLKNHEIPHDDSMTTMIVLIYRKGKLVAGIAGDGGILAERTDGSIEAMITAVKTSSMVYPLSSRTNWKFFSSIKESPLPVSRILAATDGVFDSLCGWNGRKLACHVRNLQEFFAISKVKPAYRNDRLKELCIATRSPDDLSCILIEDPKYFV